MWRWIVDNLCDANVTSRVSWHYGGFLARHKLSYATVLQRHKNHAQDFSCVTRILIRHRISCASHRLLYALGSFRVTESIVCQDFSSVTTIIVNHPDFSSATHIIVHHRISPALRVIVRHKIFRMPHDLFCVTRIIVRHRISRNSQKKKIARHKISASRRWISCGSKIIVRQRMSRALQRQSYATVALSLVTMKYEITCAEDYRTSIT